MSYRELVYSTEVLDFIKTAKEFCVWAEECPAMEKHKIIERGMQLLPLLYSRMVAIPLTEPVFEEGNEKYVTEKDWSDIFQGFSVLLGLQNGYPDLADNEEYDRSEITTRYISEDIADIYQDIKDCTEIFRIGNEEVMNDALWECRSGFENHWGEKSLRAAAQLHKIYFSVNPSDPQDNEGDITNKYVNTNTWFLSRRQKEFRDEDYELPE